MLNISKLRSRRLAPKQKPEPVKRKKAATTDDKKHMSAVAELGCLIADANCKGRTTIHHCDTFSGGGRDHKKIIPLCEAHHLRGPCAIDGKKIGKRVWEKKYGDEESLLAKVDQMLKRAPSH